MPQFFEVYIFVFSFMYLLCIFIRGVKAGFHMIADRRSQIAIRSAIVCDQLRLCDHMEIKVLRSAIETHPIIFRVLSQDSTLVCSIVGTVYVATIISLPFREIYGASCSL